MSLKATERKAGDVIIVDLAGRLTLGEGSGLVRNTIKDLVTGGVKSILLNLNDVTYIDSAGLGELVGAYASVTNAGGQIKLMHVQEKVRGLLQVTKLYTVFAAFDNEDAAVHSFAKSESATT